jgi:hypothetical protein
VHNLLIHYRVPLFNRLAKRDDFEFDFFFGASHELMASEVTVEKQYRPTFQWAILRGLRMPDYRYLSPSLLFYLRHPYDAYVSGPLGSPDCWLVFLIAKLFRRPFILWDERWGPTRSFLSKLAQPLQSFVVKKSDSVIVPGTRAFEYFSRSLGGTQARSTRLFIAPNASTLEIPSPNRVEN